MSNTILLRPVAPELESRLRSIHSHHAATIRIINDTDEDHQVFWLSYSGERSRCHADLPARGQFEGQTYSTHPFLLSDYTGKARAIFVAEASECIAHLQSPLILNSLSTESITELRSVHSYQPATLKIINETDSHFAVYWLDFEGKRHRCDSQLSAHGQFEQFTYATHPFVVVDSADSIYATFIAEAADCIAYLRTHAAH